MKNFTRREFLVTGSMAAAGLAMFASCNGDRQVLEGVRIGVIDINGRDGIQFGGLGRPAELSAVEKAARIGFEGVEITFGGPDEDGILRLAREERQQQYLDELDAHGITAAGTHLMVLHENHLKNPDDPLAVRWVEQAIPATRKMGTEVILLPFFFDGAIEERHEQEYVADVLRELAPEAEANGVILGLENTLSAEDNMFVLERVNSPAVKVYYDVGNSTNFGHDIYSEIPFLGDNICQFHIKDNPHYMGQGEIDFERVFRLIDEINFQGWMNIETLPVSGEIADREQDLRINLEYTWDTIAKL
ncbi:MAG: sugar phosphate isomerase/epimerase [Balneolaceae bacterium]|nr:sugar phosphate isomerase/epimerase [Balneolaceae bacterium]